MALNVRITSPGLVPMILSRTFNDKVNDSESISVVLQKGVSIGGLVVDPSDRAISNVSVIPFLVRSTGPHEYTRTDLTLGSNTFGWHMVRCDLGRDPHELKFRGGASGLSP